MRAQLNIPREFRKLEEKESIHSVGNTTLLQNTCWLASNHIRACAYHVKEVNWKSENICGLVPLVPQTPIWQFRKVWYYVSLKKIVWYYTSLRVWYYTSLIKSVWYSTSLCEYDTICMILCALPLKRLHGIMGDRIDEPIFIAGSKRRLAEFGIYHKLDSDV